MVTGYSLKVLGELLCHISHKIWCNQPVSFLDGPLTFEGFNDEAIVLGEDANSTEYLIMVLS